MIVTAFHGFCMALADSVPGVSGGTIAFILGFYERFLDALHGIFREKGAARKAAAVYLLKLGTGWVLGMGACVVLLSSLFEQNIYFMSSLFLGLTVCSIPFVVTAERGTLQNSLRQSWALLLGSLYAIANGPASLDVPQPPLGLATFQPLAFVLGAAVLLALEGLRKAAE